jgi:hypothetical protein
MLQELLGQSKTSWWMTHTDLSDPPRKRRSLDTQGSSQNQTTHVYGTEAHPPQSVEVKSVGCSSAGRFSCAEDY